MIAASVDLVFDRLLINDVEQFLFIAAAAVSAWRGGRGPALLCTFLLTLLLWFTVPGASPAAVTIRAGAYCLCGCLIAVLGGRMRGTLHEVEARHTDALLAMDTLPQFVWTCDAELNRDYLNAHWSAYTGLGKPAQGHAWLKSVHPDDLPRMVEDWNRAVKANCEFRSEYRVARSDGTYEWHQGRGVPLPDRDGRVRWVGSTVNIQVEHEAREALRREKEKLETLVTVAPAVFCCVNLTAAGTSSIPFASPRIREIFSIEPEVLAESALPALRSVHPEDVQRVRDTFRASAASMSEAQLEFRVRKAEDNEIWVESRFMPMRSDNGDLQWFGFLTDITERKTAERIARENEDRLQFALEASETGFFEYDLADGTFRESKQHSRIFGFADHVPANWNYETFLERVHEEDRARVRLEAGPHAQGKQTYQCRIRRADGEIRWIWVCRDLVPDPKGGPGRRVGIVQDVTERHRLTEAARRQVEREAERLRTMVAEAPVALVMLDRRLRVIQASRRWLEQAGVPAEKAMGSHLYELFRNLDPEVRAAHERALAGEPQSGSMTPVESWDGRKCWVNWQLQPWGDPGEQTGGIIIYSEDVTAHRQAEEAARKSEVEYRKLFDHMAHGLAYCRAIFQDNEPVDFEYLAVNPAFAELTGLHEVVGKRISEVLPGFGTADHVVLESHCRVAKTGVPEKLEFPVTTLQRWYSASVYSPAPNCFVSLFDDITERRRVQQELERNRMRLQLALDVSQLGIFEYDREGAGFTASSRWQAITGLGPNPTVEEVLDRIPPEDHHHFPIASPDAHDSWDTQVRIVLPNGETRWLHSRAARHSSDGRTRTIGVSQDITVQKLSQLALRRSEELYRAIARSIPGSGLWVVDAALRVLVAEGDLAARFRQPGVMPTGLKVREYLLDAPYLESVESALREALEGHTRETELESRGLTLWTRFVPLRDDSGAVVAAMALSLDISERRRAEREVQLLNRELEERVERRTAQLEAINRELEAFTYSVSHDLRAPLRGIDGWSLALLEDYGEILDQQAHRYLNRVRSESQRMGLLIDDLLQLSRVSRAELKLREVSLTTLVRTIVDRIQESSPGRNMEFVIQPDLTAKGDPRLLEIALTNLLDNAAKFTQPRPQAHIEFGTLPDSAETAFFVRDNGVGFDMDYATKLFGPFQRMHAASEFPGSGIGLATVERIVRRHGGRIWAEACVNQGATFFFSLGDNE